jgi:hypothetical protein
LRVEQIGTRAAIPTGMKELTLTADQLTVITAPVASATPAVLDAAALMAMPLVDAKRLVAAEFERRYLVCLMERAGSVSEGARASGIDRTNFRRLLQRHGLR